MKTSPKLFQFGLSSLAVVALGAVYCDRASALTGFNGIYDASNFNLVSTNSDGSTGDGSVNTTNAPIGTVVLTGGDNKSGFDGTTTWTIANPLRAALWSFTWSYFSFDDPGFDDAGYVINGIYTVLSNSSGDFSNQPVTFQVQEGDIVGFEATTFDNLTGAGVLTVNNFQVTQVPFEFSPTLGLVGLGTLAVYKSLRKSSKK